MNLKLFPIFLIIATTLFAQSYQNLTLQECIEIAKKNSLILASSRLSEQTAESALKQARNQNFPNLVATAQQEDRVSGRPLLDSSKNSYVNRLSVGLNTSVQLNTGTINHTINQAEFSKEIAILNTEASERNLSESVINAYMQVWFAMESENSSKLSLELSKKMLEKDSVLFKAGSFTTSDLALAYAQVASDSLSILQAQSALVQNLTRLRQLLEIPYGTEFSLAPPDSAKPEAAKDYSFLLKKAEENSVDKIIDSLSILSADEGIGIAKSGRWPRITLSAGLGSFIDWDKEPKYGTQAKNNFDYNAGFAIGVTIDIIDWGAVDHDILQAQVRKEQAQITAQNTQKQLENSIEQLALQIETYRLQWEVSTIQLTAQKLSLDKSIQQHELGMLDISSLIQQQTIYNNSIIRHNQAKYNYLLGKSLLDLQTGE